MRVFCGCCSVIYRRALKYPTKERIRFTLCIRSVGYISTMMKKSKFSKVSRFCNLKSKVKERMTCHKKLVNEWKNERTHLVNKIYFCVKFKWQMHEWFSLAFSFWCVLIKILMSILFIYSKIHPKIFNDSH